VGGGGGGAGGGFFLGGVGGDGLGGGLFGRDGDMHRDRAHTITRCEPPARTTTPPASQPSARFFFFAQASRQHGKTPHRHHPCSVALVAKKPACSSPNTFLPIPLPAVPIDRIVYESTANGGQLPLEGRGLREGNGFEGCQRTAIGKQAPDRSQTLHVGIGGRGVGSDHAAFCKANVLVFLDTRHQLLQPDCDTVEQIDSRHMADIAHSPASSRASSRAPRPTSPASRTKHGRGG